MGVVDPLVVHGNAEISGGAEGLHFRVHLFKRAPHGFLSLVNAEEDLRRGSGWEVGQAAVSPMAREALQNFAFVPALIGQVEDAAAFQPIACFYFTHERFPFGVGQPGYLVCGKRHHSGSVVNARRPA